MKLTPHYLSVKKHKYGKILALASLGLCLIVSMFYWDPNQAISSILPASYNMVFVKAEYWRLFTAVFAHADLDHLLSNSLMLLFLSYFVTSFYGWKVFLYLFFCGGLINAATVSWIGGDGLLVGASGVVYCLWGFWLSLYVLIAKKYTLINRLFRVGAIFLVLLIPTTYSPSTSYFAHYFGFCLGAFSGILYYFGSGRRPSKVEVEQDLLRFQKPPVPPQVWEDGIDWEDAEESDKTMP